MTVDTINGLLELHKFNVKRIEKLEADNSMLKRSIESLNQVVEDMLKRERERDIVKSL